jgi:hypothetical protein
MIPFALRRGALHGAAGVVLACGICAGVVSFAREIQNLRHGSPTTAFPREMPRFRRVVFATLPPEAGLVFADTGGDPWVGVLVEKALFPHPVWIVQGSDREIKASIRQLRSNEGLRFIIVAGNPPRDPGLLHPRPLPRFSRYSSSFLFGEIAP